MKLPFIQHIGIGIYFTARAVWWVELSRIHERVWLRRCDSEPIPDEPRDKRHALERRALERIINRLRPEDTLVATHLAPSMVREYVVRTPEFDDDEPRENWLRRDAAKRVPAAADMQKFVVRSRPLRASDAHFTSPEHTDRHSTVNGSAPYRSAAYGKPEKQMRYLVAVARRSAVQARREMLEAVGLVPRHIGSLSMLMGYSLGFETAFDSGWSAGLHLYPGASRLGLFNAGAMADLKVLPQTASTEVALDEAQSQLSLWRAELKQRDPGLEEDHIPLYVMGETADELATTDMERGVRLAGSILREEGCLGEERPALSDARLARKKDGRGARAVPALGLAAGVIYDVKNQSNFLSTDHVEKGCRQVEKRDAVRVILGAATVLLFLLAFITGASYWLQHKVSEADLLMAAASEHLARIESAETKAANLRANLERARGLARSRTRVAAALSEISRRVPSDVWLDELTVEHPDTRAHKTSNAERDTSAPRPGVAVVLRGWALEDRAPGAFVRALEEGAGLHNIRPVLVERLSGEEVTRQTREAWKRPLTWFEIHAHARLRE